MNRYSDGWSNGSTLRITKNGVIYAEYSLSSRSYQMVEWVTGTIEERPTTPIPTTTLPKPPTPTTPTTPTTPVPCEYFIVERIVANYAREETVYLVDMQSSTTLFSHVRLTDGIRKSICFPEGEIKIDMRDS